MRRKLYSKGLGVSLDGGLGLGVNGVAIGGSSGGSSGDLFGGAYLGEGAALLAAFLWAAATLMFGRLGLQLSPLVLNIVKGVFAIALMLITLAIQFSSVGMPSLPVTSVFYLFISGALGIGLGDTAYFGAINALGARRALLLETLAPPMAAVLAWIFLAEQLSGAAIAGIIVTLTGVAWVISERVPGSTLQGTGAGIKIALLATFCQASGAVLSRAALAETAVSPLWSSLIRLSAGLVFMGVLALLKSEYLESSKQSNPTKGFTQSVVSPLQEQTETTESARWHRVAQRLRSPRLMGSVAAAAFFGTYLGIWLQQVSLKYTAAGIAQALLATSPLFVIPMAALLGDKISWRAVIGVGIALSGVWLLLFAS